MDLATFDVNNGFVEAKLRGYLSTNLKEEHYNHMNSLNSLKELFQVLSSRTDYDQYIDSNNVSINSLKNAMKKKLSDELSKSILYNRAAHMIDNVMEGLKAGRSWTQQSSSSTRCTSTC